MFNLGLSEIILISVIALIFIGPKQLPEIARAIGKALNELKRASEDLTTSITNPKNYERSQEPPPAQPASPAMPEKMHQELHHETHQVSVEASAEPLPLHQDKKDEGSST